MAAAGSGAAGVSTAASDGFGAAGCGVNCAAFGSAVGIEVGAGAGCC